MTQPDALDTLSALVQSAQTSFEQAATPADLDAITLPDEAAWIEERRSFLLY